MRGGDRSVLTTGELQSILAGLRSIEGIEKKANIERLVQKLAPDAAASGDVMTGDGAVVSLRDSIVIDLASHYKNDLSDKIGRIKDAINDRHLIEFDYYYAKGQTRRRIEPYFIAV